MNRAGRLLTWYDANRREFPWRGRTDPYEIWVSEVMLQQTRVETAEPYYLRFLDEFPTVEALAAAPIEDVLAVWSGLGYYRRARQLHQAATQVVADGGDLPRTPEGLRELPGVGPYTAAAIASIAFGAREPVLDGNVERVLTRLTAFDENPRTAAARRHLVSIARDDMPAKRPGDFNQAMMELGATVCKPRRPDCARCPLSPDCRALATGEPEAFPALPRRRAQTREARLMVVVRRSGRVLLHRRDDSARQMPGVWELPWVLAGEGDAASALAERYGGRWHLEPPVAEVRHSITTRALEVSICHGEWEPPPADSVHEATALAWIETDRLGGVATTSLVDKAMSALAAADATAR